MEISNLTDSSLFNMVMYVITAVIGGVIFKYYQEWNRKNTITEDREQTSIDTLVQNLFKSIETSNERITKLELENQQQAKALLQREEQFFKQQLDLVKQLAVSESKVQTLEHKVRSLEDTQEKLKEAIKHYEMQLATYEGLLKKYQTRFGQLENVNENN